MPSRLAAQDRAQSGWSWENDSRRRSLAIRACLVAYGRTCHLCGTPGAVTADHVIPRSQGGTHDLANLRPAHRHCNYARRDMTLDEWFAKHPLPTAPTLTPSRDW